MSETTEGLRERLRCTAAYMRKRAKEVSEQPEGPVFESWAKACDTAVALLSHREPEGREADAWANEATLEAFKSGVPWHGGVYLQDRYTEGATVPVYFGDTPPREPDSEAASLLFNWLNSETQMIRDSYVPKSDREDPARVDAAWNHYDPDGFALAVATRKYLERVGYSPAGAARESGREPEDNDPRSPVKRQRGHPKEGTPEGEELATASGGESPPLGSLRAALKDSGYPRRTPSDREPGNVPRETSS